jgi:hypothetical protein
VVFYWMKYIKLKFKSFFLKIACIDVAFTIPLFLFKLPNMENLSYRIVLRMRVKLILKGKEVNKRVFVV